MKKVCIAFVLFGLIIGCAKKDSSEEADMYEASELSALMRDMVEFSKQSKKSLSDGNLIDSIPAHFWNLQSVEATRGEHEEAAFQGMTQPYLDALKGIERGDSQAYYYQESIDACKSCHAVYCGGPMSIINKL